MKRNLIITLLSVFVGGFLHGATNEQQQNSEQFADQDRETDYQEMERQEKNRQDAEMETIKGKIVAVSDYLGTSNSSEKSNSSHSNNESLMKSESKKQSQAQSLASRVENKQYILVGSSDGILGGLGGGEETYLLLQDSSSRSGEVAFNKISRYAESPHRSNMQGMRDSDRQNVRGSAEEDTAKEDREYASHKHDSTKSTEVKVTGKIVEKGDLQAILVSDIEEVTTSSDE